MVSWFMFVIIAELAGYMFIIITGQAEFMKPAGYMFMIEQAGWCMFIIITGYMFTIIIEPAGYMIIIEQVGWCMFIIITGYIITEPAE